MHLSSRLRYYDSFCEYIIIYLAENTRARATDAALIRDLFCSSIVCVSAVYIYKNDDPVYIYIYVYAHACNGKIRGNKGALSD